MSSFDWRELYAANQETIARAGIPRSGLTSTLNPASAANRVAANTAPAPASDARALVHIPRGLERSVPAAMVCMLHGCGQRPETFAAATAMNDLADRHGFVVVYPGQQRASNPQGCWNWFLPEHQRRGAGEPAAIAEILRRVIETDPRCTIDPARVFVAGISAGAAMALIVASCYPDLIAAVAVHSGLPYRSAHDVSSAFQAMAGAKGVGEASGHAIHLAMGRYARPVPNLVIHGSADHTVKPVNARLVLQQTMHANHLAAPDTCHNDLAHPTTTYRTRIDGGRAYTHSRWTDVSGTLMHEAIEIDGLGHAWSGGTPGGSYTDPKGPSATGAVWTFFSRIS